MARDLGRFLARWKEFKDLSVGIELREESGHLFARMQFSATLGTRRKTTKLNISLDEAIEQFSEKLPEAGKEEPIEAPIAITPVDDAKQ